MPIYVLKTNTTLQMENMLASLFDLEADPQEAALRETAEAIGLVQASGRPVELAPQNAYVRRLQHQMAEQQRPHVALARLRAEPARRAHPRGRRALAVSGRVGRIVALVILALVALALVATSVIPPA